MFFRRLPGQRLIERRLIMGLQES